MQYYPIVIFCVPESRPALKALREWLAPASRRSSRRLYAQAQKLQKHNGHLFTGAGGWGGEGSARRGGGSRGGAGVTSALVFTATVPLHGTDDSWYQEIKAVVQQQQTLPIWTAEDQVRGAEKGGHSLGEPHK